MTATRLWLMTDKQTLAIREVNPVWTEQGFIYLHKEQLGSDTAVITSDLPAPVPGMAVRVENSQ